MALSILIGNWLNFNGCKAGFDKDKDIQVVVAEYLIIVQLCSQLFISPAGLFNYKSELHFSSRLNGRHAFAQGYVLSRIPVYNSIRYGLEIFRQ